MRRSRRRPRRRIYRVNYRNPRYIGYRRNTSIGFSGFIIMLASILFLYTNIPIIYIAIIIILLISGKKLYTNYQRTRISRIIYTGRAETIHDISIRTGMPEDRIRSLIMTGKRDNILDVHFDPQTGVIKPSRESEIDPNYDYSAVPPEERKYCEYCGFILKPEDRFCPYCGAPVKHRTSNI